MAAANRGQHELDSTTQGCSWAGFTLLHPAGQCLGPPGVSGLVFIPLSSPPSPLPVLCLHCCPAASQLGFPVEPAQFPSEMVFQSG